MPYSKSPHVKRTRFLLWGATIGLAIVLVLGAAATKAYLSANQWVYHTFEVQKLLDQWVVALLDAQTRTRNYLLAGQGHDRTRYEEALEQERAIAAQVKMSLTDNRVEWNHVTKADREALSVVETFRGLVKFADSGNREQAIQRSASAKTQQGIDGFRTAWMEVREEQERVFRDRQSRSMIRARLVLVCTFMLGIGSCVLLVVAWKLQRSREEFLRKLAFEARNRVQNLSVIATSLAQARTREQVVRVLLNQAMQMAEADTCALFALDESGAALDLLGERGIPPEVVRKLRRITSTTFGNSDILTNVLLGTSLWAENESDYQALFPALATLQADGPKVKSFWTVPLFAEGGPLGLFAMGFFSARKFSEEDRQWVDTLAKQCAQSLLRATRMEREDGIRRWLDTVLRSIGDAVIATDAKGCVTFMNPVAENLTGVSEVEAKGQPLGQVYRVFADDTHEPLENPFTKILREGAIVGFGNPTLLHSKTGIAIPISHTGAPIRNESGEIAGIVMVFRNATEEKRTRVRREFLAKAMDALLSSLEYQTTLAIVAQLAVPAIADGCAITLEEPGNPLPYQAAAAHVDPAKLDFALKLGEMSPPHPDGFAGALQVIRTGIPELYPQIPEYFLQYTAKDDDHLQQIRELNLESAMIVPLKTRETTFGAITLIQGESGRHFTQDDLEFAGDFARRAAMAVENALSLQDAKAAREEERLLRSRAENASRAKDEFLAMVSHELRTPLGAILGWSVLLRGRSPSPDMERGLVVIERNARVQAKLVEDVLDVSRIISGKLSLNLNPTNLADVIRAAVETVTPAVDAKGIKLTTDIEDKTLSITADGTRLHQIIWNVLSNAVKFTPKGGSILIDAHRNGSKVSITVTDTGEGISPTALPFIFDLFQQADGSTTRRHGGLGLGLAIVKRLVSAHGGTVKVTSEGEGQGSVFVIQLPMKVSPLAMQEPKTENDPSDNVVQRGFRLDGLKVLLVDDEEDTRMVLGEVLSDHGAKVHLASSAADALERIAELRPDVLLSDIGMPVMDGFALIRTIRALPAELGGNTPAAALTAYARVEDAQRAFAAGYQLHVAKPIEPLQLTEVVAKLGGLTVEKV